MYVHMYVLYSDNTYNIPVIYNVHCTYCRGLIKLFLQYSSRTLEVRFIKSINKLYTFVLATPLTNLNSLVLASTIVTSKALYSKSLGPLLTSDNFLTRGYFILDIITMEYIGTCTSHTTSTQACIVMTHMTIKICVCIIYTHTNTHTSVQTQTHTRTCTNTHTDTHTKTQTHRHTDTWMDMHGHTHTEAQTHRHMDGHTHKHTHTHTHTHTQTTHTPTSNCSLRACSCFFLASASSAKSSLSSQTCTLASYTRKQVFTHNIIYLYVHICRYKIHMRVHRCQYAICTHTYYLYMCLHTYIIYNATQVYTHTQTGLQ